MLDFDTASCISEKLTKSTQVRHDDRLASLIERAALALAVTSQCSCVPPLSARQCVYWTCSPGTC